MIIYEIVLRKWISANSVFNWTQFFWSSLSGKDTCTYIRWLRVGPRADSSFVLILDLFLLCPPIGMSLCQQANADGNNEGNLFKMLERNPCLKTHSQGQKARQRTETLSSMQAWSQQTCWAPNDKED